MNKYVKLLGLLPIIFLGYYFMKGNILYQLIGISFFIYSLLALTHTTLREIPKTLDFAGIFIFGLFIMLTVTRNFPIIIILVLICIEGWLIASFITDNYCITLEDD